MGEVAVSGEGRLASRGPGGGIVAAASGGDALSRGAAQTVDDMWATGVLRSWGDVAQVCPAAKPPAPEPTFVVRHFRKLRTYFVQPFRGGAFGRPREGPGWLLDSTVDFAEMPGGFPWGAPSLGAPTPCAWQTRPDWAAARSLGTGRGRTGKCGSAGARSSGRTPAVPTYATCLLVVLAPPRHVGERTGRSRNWCDRN